MGGGTPESRRSPHTCRSGQCGQRPGPTAQLDRILALEDSARAWATPARPPPTPQCALSHLSMPPTHTLPRVLPRAHLALAGSCLPKDVVYLQQPLANKQAG